jgi:thiamine biosynthesis protein ThiS
VNIEVTLYGELKKYLKPGTQRVEATAGATVADLLASLGVDPAHPRIAAINDETVDETHVLADGDHLEVFHAVAGGLTGSSSRITHHATRTSHC